MMSRPDNGHRNNDGGGGGGDDDDDNNEDDGEDDDDAMPYAIVIDYVPIDYQRAPLTHGSEKKYN